MDKDYQRKHFEFVEKQRKFLAEKQKFNVKMRTFESGLKAIILEQGRLNQLFILGKL